MSTALAFTEYESLTRELSEQGLAHLRQGDYLIDPREGRLFRILHFARHTTRGGEPGDWYAYLECPSWQGDDTWHGYGDIELHDFLRGRYVRLDGPPGDESLDAMVAELVAVNTEANVEETGLAVTATPEALRAMRDAVFSQKSRMLAIQGLIVRKVNLAKHQASALEEQLSYLNKVIEVGDLYLGTHEHVTTLRTGRPADPDEPLTIWQLARYMDEEVGVVNLDDEVPFYGLQFEDVGKFDRWLLTGNNLDSCLPSPKGIALFRVTRHHKEERSPMEQIRRNAENMQTYLLVRNGENLHRLWLPLSTGSLLYPRLGEWQELMAKKEKRGKTTDLEGAEFDYKKCVALLQGIIDRTDLLQPFPPGVNLFDGDTYQEGEVVFARDAEVALGSSGRPGFREWKQGVNATTRQGTRILLGPIPYDTIDHKGSHFDRFPHYTGNSVPYSFSPAPGIYVVEEYWAENPEGHRRYESYLIRFHPGDTVYTYDWRHGHQHHERKLRVAFRCYPSDDFVLNFDDLDLGDIEYFINARHERGGYLRMLPILGEARKQKLAEMRLEDGFVALVGERSGKAEPEIRDAIAWWKGRTKHKRGLTTDDAKALRMIEQTLATGAWRR